MPLESMFHSTTGHDIPLVCEPRCKFCFKPVPDAFGIWAQCSDCTRRLRDGHLENIRLHPYAFERSISASMYIPDGTNHGIMGNMVLEMKNGTDHFDIVSETMAHVLCKELDPGSIDILGFIPSRSHEHGIAREIARRLGETLGKKVNELIRFDETIKRSKSIQGEMKFKNALGHTSVLNEGAIERNRILLVDDIITTCGTAHWSARSLLDAGARSVNILTACRTVRKNHLDFIGYSGKY